MKEDSRRGFTIILVPHHGGLGRQLEVRGQRLALFYLLVLLVLALLGAAVLATVWGLSHQGRTAELVSRVGRLEDSLSAVRGYQHALEEIEAELEELREARRRVENILCLVPGESQDSLSTGQE
ncbi:hypothetical protein JW921_05200 [Candidatus Fermentibacterales bacterium]|nr:hypothetical protein [Candidatus Fermentibacterales bacterium]